MDSNTIQVILMIVVIVGVFEFFHIGYLVNSINKEAKKQTRLIRLMFMSASGQSLVGQVGVLQIDLNNWNPIGPVWLENEMWDCKANEPLALGTKVRVKAIEGLTLIVEKASA